MKQKVLYVAALMLLSSSFGMAKKKVEDPEITKLKAKIENVMSQVEKAWNHPVPCLLGEWNNEILIAYQLICERTTAVVRPTDLYVLTTLINSNNNFNT